MLGRRSRGGRQGPSRRRAGRAGIAEPLTAPGAPPARCYGAESDAESTLCRTSPSDWRSSNARCATPGSMFFENRKRPRSPGLRGTLNCASTLRYRAAGKPASRSAGVSPARRSYNCSAAPIARRAPVAPGSAISLKCRPTINHRAKFSTGLWVHCSEGMQHDLDQLRQQAERARWWAVSTPDPIDRLRLESVARDYEQMAAAAARDDSRVAALGRYR